MKISILNKYKKSSKYNWTLDHLKSNLKLKANPYLWTRINSELDSHEKKGILKSALLSKVSETFRWVLPLLFIFSVSFGAYIGFQLSNDMRKWMQPRSEMLPVESENYELELIHEQDQELLTSPLNIRTEDM